MAYIGRRCTTPKWIILSDSNYVAIFPEKLTNKYNRSPGGFIPDCGVLLWGMWGGMRRNT